MTFTTDQIIILLSTTVSSLIKQQNSDLEINQYFKFIVRRQNKTKKINKSLFAYINQKMSNLNSVCMCILTKKFSS